MIESFEYAITCIGETVSSDFIEKIVALLMKKKCTVYKTQRETHSEWTAMTLSVATHSPHEPSEFIKTFGAMGAELGVNVIVQKKIAYDRGKKLVVMDLDSTLVAGEGIDELAKEAGVGDAVVLITKRAMNGEIPFQEALRERVRLLKGLSVSSLDTVYRRIHLTPGALELAAALKKHGMKTAVLTGGFDYFADKIKEKLNLTYAFSNQLEIKNGVLTGKVLGEIVDGMKKLHHMKAIAKKEGIALEDVVAIGDGANDLPMIGEAGLGIAFNAKPSVRKVAPYNITQKNLTVILPLLGISLGQNACYP
ncbi:MAG: phosphoserine phosphatase SerB [Nitrospirota bacterium]